MGGRGCGLLAIWALGIIFIGVAWGIVGGLHLLPSTLTIPMSMACGALWGIFIASKVSL